MKAVKEPGFAYQAVYRYLMRLIAEPAGDGNVRLPSLRQLADRLNVSISTIQYAYSLLEKEGRIYSVAKSGYYVRAVVALAPPAVGNDLLETVYVNARRPGMRLLSAEDRCNRWTALCCCWSGNCCVSTPASQRCSTNPAVNWNCALYWRRATPPRQVNAGTPKMSTSVRTCVGCWKSWLPFYSSSMQPFWSSRPATG